MHPHESLREAMLNQQIRPWDVVNEQVIDLLRKTPREAFIPKPYQNLAFVDTQTPIGYGQHMFSPKEEARILQALAIKPHEFVLEVGTGSGYFTALMARLAAHVLSVEMHPELSQHARNALQTQGIYNTTLEIGNGAQGWAEKAPYDVIVITGSLEYLPSSFESQLRVGGRLLAILGKATLMEVCLFTRSSCSWKKENLFETVVPPLGAAPHPTYFEF